MRDRLTELLPLLLVGVVLLAFQLTRSGASNLAFLPLAPATPTPEARARPTDVRPAPRVTVGGVQSTGVCDAAQPRFVGGLMRLKAALGATMGAPVECEHAIDSQGNTEQQTTTGLAYYLTNQNAACFTTGWDHWAMISSRGLIHWASDASNPPADASVLTH